MGEDPIELKENNSLSPNGRKTPSLRSSIALRHCLFVLSRIPLNRFEAETPTLGGNPLPALPKNQLEGQKATPHDGASRNCSYPATVARTGRDPAVATRRRDEARGPPAFRPAEQGRTRFSSSFRPTRPDAIAAPRQILSARETAVRPGGRRSPLRDLHLPTGHRSCWRRKASPRGGSHDGDRLRRGSLPSDRHLRDRLHAGSLP